MSLILRIPYKLQNNNNDNLQSTTTASEYMWGTNTPSTPSHTERYQTTTNIVIQLKNITVDRSKFSNLPSDKIINNLYKNPDTILPKFLTHTNIITLLLK